MITDDKSHIRELAVRRVLKARSMSQLPSPRLFEVRDVNFSASNYIDMINWQQTITEPPILKHPTDQEIQQIVQSGGEGDLLFLRLPCHTQAVGRAVELTAEAATSQCNDSSRLGAIKAKLESRKKMPKFETKRDFKAD